MLLSVVTLPSDALAGGSRQNPATVTIDTFPIFENQIAVRQAHIAWLAAKEEAGMQATIAYVASVNGSATTLSSIHENFRQSQTGVGQAGSHAALDAILQEFRGIAQAFRDETAVQMKAAEGILHDLRTSVQSALAASASVESLGYQYWHTRETTDLADFDVMTDRAGAMLTEFRRNGYEITTAQEKLTEIITMRNELASALRTRDNPGIEQAHKKIHTASIGFAQSVRDLRVNVPPDAQIRQKIEQGSAVMTRAGMVNTDLTSRGLLTGAAETYVANGTAQLAIAANQLDNGNTEGAKATLLQFRTTVQYLRDSYRMVLVKEDLPQTTAQGVLSVAQALDMTAARMAA